MRAPLLLLFLLGACIDTSDEPSTASSGLAAGTLVGTGELQAFDVPEVSQGRRDLNGDGDALDDVLHVIDLADSTQRNLALALEPGSLAVGDVLVAFAVSEPGEGGTDLNADGDANDVVLHVYDSASRSTTNTGLATIAAPPAIGAGSVAFLVSEAAQGADLNGDGDGLDLVLHVYAASTRQSTNSQLSATSNPLFHDHAFAFTTDEASSAADLNGDGDQDDGAIFVLYDLLLGGIEQAPVAIRGRPLAVGSDDWHVLVDEASQALDLNADGDQLDGVWHALDPHGGAQTPLGFSSRDVLGSTEDGSVLALAAQEIDGLDANLDGDEDDTFVFLRDPAGGVSFAPELAVAETATFVLVGQRLLFLVNEAHAGLDLNGDLDLGDDVLHVLNVTSGSVSNRGLALVGLAGVGQNALLWRAESETGQDQNGDGDTLDTVLAKFDPLAGTVVGLGLAGTPPLLAAGGTMALVTVPEGAQGQDLNGDGDRLDLVAWRIEVVFSGGSPQLSASLEVGVEPSGAVILGDGSGLVRVSESAQGRDLNGDLDLFDSILSRFE